MTKIIYIAHPISGDIEGNISKILQICKDIHTEDIIPFIPYVATLQYLDDNKIEERRLGMYYNAEYFKRRIIDEVWVYGDNISEGVRYEIKLAERYGITVRFKNA